jgi:endonuclease YncB( thermonuclease family)
MGAGRKPYTVRLSGIDAPEDGQAWGNKSKKLLKSLIHKKIVRVVAQKKPDYYGRTIARLYVDGLDVNAAMVEQGAAWVYRRYARGSSFAPFYKAEARAKKNRLGLWRLKNPVEPWKWRKMKKKKY